MLMSQRVARGTLKLMGWKAVGELPECKSFVLIAAPHTSNWDLLFTLLAAFSLGANLRWLGKHTLFTTPVMGSMLKRLGGIPVQRSERHNMVEQMAELLEKEGIALVVPPEATRSRADTWRSGFYHIARRAQVPVGMGFVDYGARETGLGPCFIPDGDVREEMDAVRAFYATKKPLYPEKFTVPKLREEDEPELKSA